MGIHKFINTKFMIPDEYSNFKTWDKCIADVVASRSREDAKTNTPFSENLSTPYKGNFLHCDHMLESEVNHSPLLPSLICQSPLFKKILHPTLPSSQGIRFVGPAVIEKKIRSEEALGALEIIRNERKYKNSLHRKSNKNR